jgi:membrane protein DedA with SNARE-associated domain
LLLALAACVECLVVIGAFAPLTPFLVMIGAAIEGGALSPLILIWVMAGCGLGNFISYEAGRRARSNGRILAWIPPKARVRAEALFERHGALAVIIGRFAGPTASIVPFLAGCGAMPRERFLLANLFTSLVWPVAMAAVGYVGARALTR